ncbi:MAG: hypothetical protein JXA20_03845 [Spirochaetes bacterium]|nr:hypothetical protein [Spirochaetota bacterium]
MKMTHRAIPAILIAAVTMVTIVRAYGEIVNTSIAGHAGRIQAIPQTAAAAHRFCVRGPKGLEVNSAIKSLGEELEKLTKDIAIPYGMEEATAMKGKVNPEELEAKIQGMTMEQKMAFAMQMQQQMGYGATTVNQRQAPLIAQCLELNNEAISLNNATKSIERITALKTKYAKTHDDIDKATELSIKACPVLSSGESSETDPACIRAKRLAGADRHIQEANREIKEYAAIYADYSAKLKRLATRVDTLMAKAQYGRAISGTAYKEQFRTLQALTMAKVIEFYSMSRGAIEDTAKWIEQKDVIQKQP